MIAVGILSAAIPGGPLLPLAFLIATVLGAAVHVAALDVPFAEAGVVLVVLILGALLAWGRALARPYAAGLFAVAGLFHGYAYGESIIGAEPMPLAAYFVGFALIQYAIAVAALLITRRLASHAPGRNATLPRVAGCAIMIIGGVFVAGAALS